METKRKKDWMPEKPAREETLHYNDVLVNEGWKHKEEKIVTLQSNTSYRVKEFFISSKTYPIPSSVLWQNWKGQSLRPYLSYWQTPLVHLSFLQEHRLKMLAKKVSLLILFQGMVKFVVLATEQDSTASRSAYFTTQENLRLKGHVVKRFESASLMSCSHSCLKHAWCTSTNFMAPSRMNEKGTCELNKHGTIDIHTQTASLTSTKFDKQQGATFSLLLKVKYYFITRPASYLLYHRALSNVVCLLEKFESL